MPTYEYRCPACGEAFEKFQRMSDPPQADCPACGADAQRKLSGGAGLHFKGSGFYITDYARGEGYKKAAEADKGTPAAKSEKPADSAGSAANPAEAKPTSSGSSGSAKTGGE